VPKAPAYPNKSLIYPKKGEAPKVP